MKKTSQLPALLTSASCLSLTMGALQAATITNVGTTATFDENTNATNTIDVNAVAATSFASTIVTAFNNNMGGVIDWETGMSPTPTASATTSSNNTLTTIDVAYGVGAGNTLTIGFDHSIELYTNNVNSQVSALSSNGTTNNSIIPGGANDPIGLAYLMTFTGADVVEIGAGMLSRSTYVNATNGVTAVNFRATATFSDTTTSVIDYNLTASGTDTFLHFEAPTGETITSFGVRWLSDTDSNGGTGLTNGQRRPVMDDFGFVVIPEPSAALLSLAGLGLLFRRRR